MMETQTETETKPDQVLSTPAEVILAHIATVADKGCRDPSQSWPRRHLRAWRQDNVPRIARLDAISAVAMSEVAMRDAIVAWAMMGEAHAKMYASPIGEDGVLGVAWAQMGQALLSMLNGELGGLDGGTLDKLIRDIALACDVALE